MSPRVIDVEAFVVNGDVEIDLHSVNAYCFSRRTSKDVGIDPSASKVTFFQSTNRMGTEDVELSSDDKLRLLAK